MESTFTDADVSNNLRDIKSEEEGINNTLRSIDASNISQKDKNILKDYYEEQKRNLKIQSNKTLSSILNSLPSSIENIDTDSSNLMNEILNDSINDSFNATGDIYDKISSLDL